MKKKFLPIAAIVIAIGAIAAWLWPAEEPTPATAPVVAQPAPKPAAQETPQQIAEAEKKTMRVAFINHLGDAHIKFTVDDVDICTANAGQSCYGDIAYGKHVVKGLEAGKVVRAMDFTVEKDTPDPKVIVCFPTSPDC